MLVTLLTWHRGESRDMRGGGEVADGVGEERLSPSEDYSHPSLIVPPPCHTFPKFGTNFLPAHNFLPGSTKLHMLSCNSTYFPMGWWWLHLPGDKADRFTKQLLSEFSGWKWAALFPHDRQLTNNGEAAGNELTISSTIQGNKSNTILGNKSYTIQNNKSCTILGNEFANVCVRQGIAMKGKATHGHPPSTTSHYQQFNAWKREPKIIETCLKESPRKRSGMRLSEN